MSSETTPCLATPKPLGRRLLWVAWPSPLIPPGHIPVLFLSSWPCGVPTEPLSWEPHFLQLLRYSSTQEGEAALLAMLVSLFWLWSHWCRYDCLGFCDGISHYFPARSDMRHLSPNSHGFTPFSFPHVRQNKTLCQRLTSHPPLRNP